MACLWLHASVDCAKRGIRAIGLRELCYTRQWTARNSEAGVRLSWRTLSTEHSRSTEGSEFLQLLGEEAAPAAFEFVNVLRQFGSEVLGLVWGEFLQLARLRTARKAGHWRKSVQQCRGSDVARRWSPSRRARTRKMHALVGIGLSAALDP